jgi:hypothetical protein
MIRIISIVTNFLIISTSLFSQDKRNDWEDMDLKGKVKSVIIRYEDFYRRRFWDSTKYVFNKKGNAIAEYKYWRQGPMSVWYKYEYNKNGTITTTQFDPANDTILSKWVIEEDKNTRLGIITFYGFKGILESFFTIIFYDDKGKKLEEIDYEDSVTKDRSVYKSIAKQNLNEKGYNKGTSQTYQGRKKYVYDEKENKIEEYWFDKNDTLWRTILTKFDETGLMIEEVQNPGPHSYRVTYKYDSSQHLVQEDQHDYNGNIYKTERYKYDVDKKGNWIRMTRLGEGDKPFAVRVRVIEYF